MKKYINLLTILFIFISFVSYSQPIAKKDTSEVRYRKNKKLLTVSLIAGGAYAATLVGLNQLWYSQSPRSSFHFFNDNNEWNQMDKAGHFYTAFYLSTGGIDMLKWAGLSQKKAIILDNVLGLALLTPIEIMDGYSSAYGASWGDEVADAAGDVFAFAQYLAWKDIRIYPRFTVHATGYSALRPNVLGSTAMERIIKDYNGQTYWLSSPIRDWIKHESVIPKWLGIAVGYGATGMVYANPNENHAYMYSSYRRFFISPDIFLSRIKTKVNFSIPFFTLLI